MAVAVAPPVARGAPVARGCFLLPLHDETAPDIAWLLLPSPLLSVSVSVSLSLSACLSLSLSLSVSVCLCLSLTLSLSLSGLSSLLSCIFFRARCFFSYQKAVL